MYVIMNLKGEERVKKNNSFTTLLVIGGSAGIYTAFAAESERLKQKQIQQSEVKKVKEIEEKKSMESDRETRSFYRGKNKRRGYERSKYR